MGTMAGSFRRQITSKPKRLPRDIRLDGKTAIVTGANGGLGLEASKELIAHGLSRIILGVRNLNKGTAAKTELVKLDPQCDVQVWEIDQESFESLMAFGARAAKLERLDIAILNAGVKQMEFSRSGTGHETNVQVNHLSTALLSLLLLPPLTRTAQDTHTPSRLTIVTSEVHFWTPFDEKAAPSILERMDQEESFNKKNAVERYSTSKLLLVLWTRELAARVNKSKVLINCVNPGICSTSLYRSDPTPGIGVVLKLFGWSPAVGCHTLTDAATSHDDDQGAYLSEQRVTSPSDFVVSKEGQRVQTKIWDETIGVLVREAPGFDLNRVLGD
ncbi:short-chain dehydrogenase/reductase SDR [Xylariaceae sp. FL0255]|nr:short-chain dehydrogenase/reductase SDR [Xylariaceae sp. FL0255]